jgi:dTDP-4-amino-4,6-dideoxy-D-galactose acyltransferase
VNLVDPLEWDSSFFGLPIGRVREQVAADEIALAAHEADAHHLRCTYLLARAHDVALIVRAQEYGFVVFDVRIELARETTGHPAGMERLRTGDVQDLAWLAPLVRKRFRATRFFADRRFPPERSAELYVEWLRRGLEGNPQRRILVSENDDGFVLCHIDRDSSTGTIELIGVAPDAAGTGLGRALIAGAGALFAAVAVTTANVVTQGHNIAAQRLYQAHGYRTTKVGLWLHRWAGASERRSSR